MNEEKKYVLGLDIGGTSARGVLFCEDEIKEKKKYNFSDLAKVEKEQFLKEVFVFCEDLAGEIGMAGISFIGAGFPGIIDYERGVVLSAPNIKAVGGLNFAEECRRKFNIKACVENDANLFALAETTFGAVRGEKDAVGITLGTGVGGGIVMEGKIYRGYSGIAGEIGHMVIDLNGTVCGCGRRGCLEEYVSGRGIRRLSEEVLGKELEPKKVEDMARAGDLGAIKVYEKAGVYLGVGLVNVINILNPEIIIIGGGVGNAWDLMEKSCLDIIRSQARGIMAKGTPVSHAVLGEIAGAIGAALLNKENY